MQQRVGLARALAMDPDILLMDEPFSGLDPLIRRQMREELAALQKEIHKTIIFITHDLDEAITIGDRIAIMRDGEIIQLGTPEEIITEPADDFVREFTQGIPKTKVMKVGHIISDPDVICYETESREELRARMDQAGCNYAISLSNKTKYLGVISRELMDQSSNSQSDGLDECMDHSIQSVSANTSVEQVFPLLSDGDIPVPVVDESNNFVGVATQKNLLKVVASNI
jgi:glycine betaine/proline transport system ATP-binding protein